MQTQKTLLAAAAAFLLFAAPGLAAAAVCSGSGMTVTVNGDRITKYSYNGQGFAVSRLSATSYRIGKVGKLTVSGLGGKSFSGTFSMMGRNTPAIFRCQ